MNLSISHTPDLDGAVIAGRRGEGRVTSATVITQPARPVAMKAAATVRRRRHRRWRATGRSQRRAVRGIACVMSRSRNCPPRMMS